jgi:nucleoside-triphosphatase THEP1
MAHFFLEGDRFSGKSTLLQQCIHAAGLTASGFYVKRIISEGTIKGFELRSARELQGDFSLVEKDQWFIKEINGQRSKNLTVFENYGCRLLKEAQTATCDLLLLDEIGGIELQVPTFTQELLQTLKRPIKIVGVFKSEKNYRYQKVHTAGGLIIEKQRAILRAQLEEAGQILELTKDNYSEIENQLQAFLKQ